MTTCLLLFLPFPSWNSNKLSNLRNRRTRFIEKSSSVKAIEILLPQWWKHQNAQIALEAKRTYIQTNITFFDLRFQFFHFRFSNFRALFDWKSRVLKLRSVQWSDCWLLLHSLPIVILNAENTYSSRDFIFGVYQKSIVAEGRGNHCQRKFREIMLQKKVKEKVGTELVQRT